MALPTRPTSICPSCWEGPFAAQLGLLGQPLHARWDSNKKAEANWTGGYMYTTSPLALLFRSGLGCKWCEFLVRRLRERENKSRNNWWATRYTLKVRIGRKDTEWILRVIVNDAETYKEGYAVSTSPDDSAARFVLRRPRLTNVGSQATLAMAKACIDECVREHQGCKEFNRCPWSSRLLESDGIACHQMLEAPPTMLRNATVRDPETGAHSTPTRLVDCRDPDRPRLIATEGAPHFYVALSYVWGEDQPHRTIKGNLSAYMHAIAPASIPKTIRDAIWVTRQLGVGFLWTDSLCIIQDSPEDKHRELRSMRDVYLHAYLTIDAASATKASDGILEDRPPLRPELVLPFICPRDAEDVMPVLGNIYLYLEEVASDHQDVRTNNAESYTGQRAWCLQEAMLSPRVLIFSPKTVQLKCQSMTQNIGGAEHDDQFDVPRLPHTIFRSGANRQIEHGSSEWISIRRRWRNVVEDYSRRRLSYASDKLVACAGLTEMFAAALGSAYVAGFWNDDFLLQDLLWHMIVSVHSRPREYVAPSWSWASIHHSRLFYPYISTTTSRPMAAVVSCTTTAQDGAFPLGPVMDGQLILRAHLLQCRVKRSRKDEKPQVLLISKHTQVAPIPFQCS
ncbi:HET-domain-containing protein [Cubamyces sp. BRFM 1775]|nr:HET-domain-containing protein [Cubamyces sp. BRFM 1775]